jgi:hypothetical protein
VKLFRVVIGTPSTEDIVVHEWTVMASSLSAAKKKMAAITPNAIYVDGQELTSKFRCAAVYHRPPVNAQEWRIIRNNRT